MARHWVLKWRTGADNEFGAAWTKSILIAKAAEDFDLSTYQINHLNYTNSILLDRRILELEICKCLYPHNHFPDPKQGLKELGVD